MDHELAVAASFAWSGKPLAAARHGGGLLHDTYRVAFEGAPDLILQRLNEQLLTDVPRCMENIARVTEHLRGCVRSRGGDPARECLTLVPARDGAPFLRCPEGRAWRAFVMIPGTVTYDEGAPVLLRAAAEAFGRYAADLGDLPAPPLHDILPGFHDSPARHRALEAAAAAAPPDRLAAAAGELEELRAALSEAEAVQRRLADEGLLTRVCHYDTKLNNVLFEEGGSRALAVIDLDTTQPGSVLYDLGDAVRFAAATTDEDGDPAAMDLDLELFTALVEGYLHAARDLLTPTELELLVPVCRVVTRELAGRFLADYFGGDTYFHCTRPGHNLDRVRAQLALARAMERRGEAMEAVVQRHADG